MIGITASEAQNPEKTIPKAINAVPIRILLFYGLTLFILMCIYPWNQIGQNGSPFVQIFDSLGIQSAANILNIVVITAAISAINSDIFGAGRMMYGMAQDKQAPKVFTKLTKSGVPWVTVLVMSVVMLLGVYLNYLLPEKIFVIIASIATFATVWVWLMILLSHVAMRRQMNPEEVKKLKFPVPFWPIGPAITIAFMVFVIALLGFFKDTQVALLVGFAWVAILSVTFFVMRKFQKP